jgi:hypothetical protein
LVCSGPSLRMRALSLFVSERPWQLFGHFAKWERDDPTASCGLFGPGPEPVCRARSVDSTTANKIQGPERTWRVSAIRDHHRRRQRT